MKLTPLTTLPDHSGRTFVVGDLHGAYSRFMLALERELSFDVERDRIICCGDLIDRGPESANMVKLLREPWFFSTLGNHDLMMLAVILAEDPVEMGALANFWSKLGGRWAMDHLRLNQLEPLRELADLLLNCPLAYEFDSAQGKVGVIHAEVPRMDWKYVPRIPASNRDFLLDGCNALWGREQMKREIKAVKNIDLVCHGHTPISHTMQIANRIYLDTHFWHSGELGYRQFNPVETSE